MSLESYFQRVDRVEWGADTPYADDEHQRTEALARMAPQSVPASAGHVEGLHVGDYQQAIDAIRAWASPASVEIDGDSIVATATSWGITLRIEVDAGGVDPAATTSEILGRRNSTLEAFIAAMGQVTNAVLFRLDEVSASEQVPVGHAPFDVVAQDKRESAALARAQRRSQR